jgi:PAS domain S-box/PAS domain S-box
MLPRFKLTAKTLLIVNSLVITASVLLAVFFNVQTKKMAEHQLVQRGQSLAKNLAYNSEYGLLTGDSQSLNNLAKGVIRQPDIVSCIIKDKDGNDVISIDSGITPAIAKSSFDPRGMGDIIVHRKRDNGCEYYILSVPVVAATRESASEESLLAGDISAAKKTKVIGSITIVVSLDSTNRLIEKNSKMMGQLVAFIILISSLISVLWIRKTLVPVNKLVQATQVLATGKLNYRVDIKSHDEIGDLASAFNKMADDLKYSMVSINVLKDAQRDTVKEKERAEEYLSIAGSVIIAFDLTGKVILINEKGCEVLDHDKSEVVGKDWFENFVPLSERREAIDVFKKIVSGDASYPKHFESYILTSDGRERLISWNNNVLRDDNGNIQGLISSGEDITERKLSEDRLNRAYSNLKQAEEALADSEKRFMDVLYASKDAILLIDGNIFIDCNEATADMLGYPTRKDFLMSHPSKLSPDMQPDGRASFEKAEDMMRIAMEKGYNRFEWMHRKANGTDFLVEVSLTPITLHGKTVIHCLWRDLTEIRKAKEAQREHLRELEVFYKAAIGREERILELKKELEALKKLRK